MSHLGDAELIEVFYGDAPAAHDEHAKNCSECRGRFLALKEAMEAWREYDVPKRADDYGFEVWRGLVPQLGSPKPTWLKYWQLAPIAAVLLALAFFGGIWTDQKRVHDAALEDARSRERVLLMAMSDHLERSQVVLTELLHADAASIDSAEEGARARNLLEENRLLRNTALHLGDRSHAALLDDLERVLLAIAHGEANSSPQDLQSLKQRVKQEGLLWKVRMTSSNARQKGRTL